MEGIPLGVIIGIVAGITTGVIAVIGNIYFYKTFKADVDNAIEKNKISYSGVFKERIDVYKQILTYMVDIEFKLNQYRYIGIGESLQYENEIRLLINSFIRHVLINKPFISDSLIEKIDNIKRKHSDIFDKHFRINFLQQNKNTDSELIHKYFEEAMIAFNELSSVEYKILKDSIVSEMRDELSAV